MERKRHPQLCMDQMEFSIHGAGEFSPLRPALAFAARVGFLFVWNRPVNIRTQMVRKRYIVLRNGESN